MQKNLRITVDGRSYNVVVEDLDAGAERACHRAAARSRELLRPPRSRRRRLLYRCLTSRRPAPARWSRRSAAW